MTTATLSASSAKAKFRLAGGAQPLILLPVEVNGQGPFEFILDTGAGTSLLSSELAKQARTSRSSVRRKVKAPAARFGLARQGSIRSPSAPQNWTTSMLAWSI